MESRTIDQLATLDAEGQLTAAGLELLGTIASWAAEPDVSVSARERAFAAYLADDDRIRAAYMALLAARDPQSHLSDVVAQAWRSRAARIPGTVEVQTIGWA